MEGEFSEGKGKLVFWLALILAFSPWEKGWQADVSGFAGS
jgi:hypothetical protein